LGRLLALLFTLLLTLLALLALSLLTFASHQVPGPEEGGSRPCDVKTKAWHDQGGVIYMEEEMDGKVVAEEEQPVGGQVVVAGLLEQLMGKVVELAGWDCVDCGKKFKDRRCLYQHTRYLHLEPGTCNVCNEPFSSRAKLLKHVERKHTEQSDLAIICTICGKQFNDNSNFRRHVKKVCGVKKVKKPRKKKFFALECDLCDKTYKHSRTLTAHQLEKHGSSQESAVTVASIIAELLLNVKQQGTAAAEESRGPQAEGRAKPGCKDPGSGGGGGADSTTKRWSCQICDESFSKKASLWTHNYRIHNSQKHRCLVCDQTFTQSSNLKRHMAAHRAETRVMAEHEATSRATQLRRMHAIVDEFNANIADLPDSDKRKVFKAMVRENPEVLDCYIQNPLDESDIVEMIRDVNLSDRQLLKILAIVRRKWGNDKITPNVKAMLKEKKQLVNHLFKPEWLDKKDPIHFKDKDDNPISR
jgi:uncharacterized protein with PIN domain